MTPARGTVLLLLLGAGPAACGSLHEATQLPEREVASELPFVVVDTTTREDLILTLGPPWRSFEGDSILAWRLARPSAFPTWSSPAGPLRIAPVHRVEGLPMGDWPGRDPSSLIVVFDGGCVVRRVSLVRLR